MDKELLKKTWDVIVIGGGPAGMMAAGRAASLGARVLLLEKNESLGKKLLITGGGRCNVTNGELDTRTLLSKFKSNDKFLFSAFSQWSVKDTLDFFHMRHMPTKEENEKRIFPQSDKAQSVWNVLVRYMKENDVTIMSNTEVHDFELIDENSESSATSKTSHKKNRIIHGLKLKNGMFVSARYFILATGGTSRPETGSTGDGFIWAKKCGHTVSEPTASLVPIAIEDEWVKALQGITLPDVKINVIQNGQKQESGRGKILFTHFGITGPTVLNMSNAIGELLKYGPVTITIDVVPHLDHGQLNARLQDIFKTNSNKKFKNAINELGLPTTLCSIIVGLSGIEDSTFCHSITRTQRIELISLLKAMPMQVKELLGKDKAIVSSGGISLTEIDFKTMRSRLVDNLFCIGDVLDIDRPSGGYSLQLCWTTGFVAGNAVGAIFKIDTSDQNN